MTAPESQSAPTIGDASWTQSWPEGYGLEEASVLSSTSDTARARALAGELGPLWIRADRQSAGRGRRGRAWTSETGNLFATLLLRPACSPAIAAQLSYVTALAVADVVRLALPEADIGLKWPNDVRVSEAKIAGILLESGTSAEGAGTVRPAWLTIGIGLNVQSHPDAAGYPVTSLLRAGASPVPPVKSIMAALARRMDHWLTLWADGEGFAAVREAWLARAEGIGSPLEARLPKGTISGQFSGLDPSGGLILTLPDGTERIIHGGEVFFPDMAADPGSPLPP